MDSDDYYYTAVIKIDSNKRALLSIKEDREEEQVKQELLVIEEKNDLHILKKAKRLVDNGGGIGTSGEVDLNDFVAD